MKLNYNRIKALKAPGKYFDGGGLYINVSKNGGKTFRFKYRFGGKEKLLTIGTFPITSLEQAREARTEAKKLLAKDIDPALDRKLKKQDIKHKTENTLEAIAREWLDKQKLKWSNKYYSDTVKRLEDNLFSKIGNMPIKDITPIMLLDTIRIIEARGALDMANRVLQITGQIFRYAVVTCRADADITPNLRGAIATRKVKHNPHITEAEMPEFIKAVGGYNGETLTKYAVQLMVLTFVRTSEMRKAKWNEFNLDKKEWRLPSSNTKT